MQRYAWYAFPDADRFAVLGLHWFKDNQPLLWRLPKTGFDHLPKGVAQKALQPSGGRIFMTCNATALGLRVIAKSKGNTIGIDLYVNGSFYKSAAVDKTDEETDLFFFTDFDDREKEITLFLPHHQELIVKAVGVNSHAVFQSPDPTFKNPLPLAFYGSSICQGSGAYKPGMTYAAIIARKLGVDFINLGFGGAGKAEKEIVALVNAIPACGYVLDLGKSYGKQDRQPFLDMLQAIRKSHPDAPIFCITPVTSALEVHSESYADLSTHTRLVMQQATNEAGDANTHLIDGVQLLGFGEHDALSKDGLHPSDYGYHLIASRLLPTLRQALGL